MPSSFFGRGCITPFSGLSQNCRVLARTKGHPRGIANMSEASVASLPVVVADPAKVASIKSGINISDTAQITAFGDRAQREVAGFADKILAQTKNRELGDTGALLSDIISKAKGLDPAQLQ